MLLNNGKIIGVFISLNIFFHFARADLLLHPTRLVFNDIQEVQTALIDIANTGLETEIYRLHLVNKRMNEQGQLINADQPNAYERFADQLIYVSPRKITLAPYVSQTVRVGIRKPKDLVEGEYRSHLLFERIANNNEQSDIAMLAQRQPHHTEKNLQMNVQALVSASIPVFIYHGAADVKAEISDLAISLNQNQGKRLTFKLARYGNRSIHGTLVLKFISDAGKIIELECKSDIAVYHPNPYRLLHFDLTDQKLGSDKLQVSYLSHSAPLVLNELSVAE